MARSLSGCMGRTETRSISAATSPHPPLPRKSLFIASQKRHKTEPTLFPLFPFLAERAFLSGSLNYGPFPYYTPLSPSSQIWKKRKNQRQDDKKKRKYLDRKNDDGKEKARNRVADPIFIPQQMLSLFSFLSLRDSLFFSFFFSLPPSPQGGVPFSVLFFCKGEREGYVSSSSLRQEISC